MNMFTVAFELSNCLGRQAAQLWTNVGQQLHLSAYFMNGKEESSCETLELLWAVSLIIVHPYTCPVLRKVMKRIRRCEWCIVIHETERKRRLCYSR